MRRAIPILIFILILILRQAPFALNLGHLPGSSSILKETTLEISTQGLGWFENMEKGDPKEISPVFQSFHNKEQLFIGAAALRHFRFLCHCHTNPVLTDKPPPAIVT